jgi:hypothetical protein
VRPPTPWDTGSLRRFAEAELAGIVLLGVAWYGVSGTPNQKHEVWWIAAGILALVITGIAQAGLLLEALSRVRARRLAVLIDADHLATMRSGVPDRHAAGARVAVAGGKNHHAPSCQFVRGKRNLIVASDGVHAAAGRTACPACSGDAP